MGLASARRIVARRIPPPCRVSERERVPPALGKTNRFESRVEKELAHYHEAPYRWVPTTRFGYLENKSIHIEKKIGYLIKHIIYR